jgi:MFS transporter, Spinster family, sphingosine-1-phosphate transporter
VTSSSSLATKRPHWYPWLLLAFFWLIYFLNQADRQVLFSLLPLLKRELHLSDTQLGLMGSAFFWVYAILVPICGSLGDYISRKRLIISALVVWSFATATSGFAVAFLPLLLSWSATAFGEAFYYPCANSVISDEHGEKTRATAMAIHQTSAYTGIIATGALAGFIGEHAGWRVAFVSFGAAGLVLAVISAFVIRDPQRGMSEETGPEKSTVTLRQRFAELSRTPTYLLLTLAFLGMSLVNTAYLTWTPTLFVRKFHLSLAEAGFNATFWHLAAAALGVLIGGRISDKAAIRSVLSRPILQTLGLFFAAPFIFLLGWSDSRTVVLVSLVLFGVFRGLYESNLLASLYEVVSPHSRATATGLMVGVAYLFGGFAPLAIGWFSDRVALGSAMSAMSLCYVGSAILIAADCLFFFRPDSSRARQYSGLSTVES